MDCIVDVDADLAVIKKLIECYAEHLDYCEKIAFWDRLSQYSFSQGESARFKELSNE
jgi:hypothetical protein